MVNLVITVQSFQFLTVFITMQYNSNGHGIVLHSKHLLIVELAKAELCLQGLLVAHL